MRGVTSYKRALRGILLGGWRYTGRGALFQGGALATSARCAGYCSGVGVSPVGALAKRGERQLQARVARDIARGLALRR